MPCMYSFCFSFSVRLGAIIVGFVSLLQASIWVIICGIAIGDPRDASSWAQNMLDNYELLFMADTMGNIVEDPNGYVKPLFAFFIIYSVASILLIYGAFKCNIYIVYPFIALDFARLIFVCVYFVFAMMIIKENILNLGLIIGYSIIGGFVLLYMFYMWFCTVSFCQMVKELERQDDLKKSLDDVPLVQPKPIAYIGLGDHHNVLLPQYRITLGRPIY